GCSDRWTSLAGARRQASVIPLLEVAVALRPGGKRRHLLRWFFVVFVSFFALIGRIHVEVGALRVGIPLQAIDVRLRFSVWHRVVSGFEWCNVQTRKSYHPRTGRHSSTTFPRSSTW